MGIQDARVDDQEAVVVAQEKAAAEKATKVKAAQEKVVAEKVTREKAAEEKAVAEKALLDKAAGVKAAHEKSAEEGVASITPIGTVAQKVGVGVQDARVDDQEAVVVAQGPASSGIPRDIYMLWHSGFAKAPTWQQTCLWSWKYFNPTYTVHELDASSIEQLTQREQWVSNEVFNKMTIQSQSDLYRVLLLAKYGGIWADASVACNKPLDSHLDHQRDIYVFRRDDPDSKKHSAGLWKTPISPWVASWFMAAPASSYAFKALRTKVVHFLATSRTREYFWFHRIIARLVSTDTKFAKAMVVKNLPSADNSHCQDPNRYRRECSTVIPYHIDAVTHHNMKENH